MKTNYLKTTKTARYCTLGKFDNLTDEIVFVFHGYGQLAEEFINNFKTIESVKRFIIAPEALNKFYFRGFEGKIGACWMTKEDRENEIKDYLIFFDSIYKRYSTNSSSPKECSDKTKITLFGFSQGGAAASRWFVNSNLPNSRLILWGSSIPPDIDYGLLRRKLSSKEVSSDKILIIIGDEDEFITEESINSETEKLRKEKIDFELIKYSGKHNVQPELLKKLNLFS